MEMTMMFTSLVAAVMAVLGSDEGTRAPIFAESIAPVESPIWPLQDSWADRPGRNGLYLQLSGGLTTTTDSNGPGEEINFDEGFALAGTIGTRMGAYDDNAVSWDLEFEVLYTDQDADDSGTLQAVTDVTVLAGLLNGIINLDLTRALELYLGAGIGAAGLDVGTTTDALNDFDEEDGPFLAWQAKAGVRLWATQSTSFFLGYRFLNIDDAEVDDDLGGASFELETQEHIAELGIRFQL